MPVVTEVKEQARNPKRRSVFVDGAYAFSMTVDELIEHRIAVGSVLSSERVAALTDELEVRRAKEAAFRLLGYRARSESEVRSRLQQKQYPDAVIERVLSDLQRLGMIDDRQFAASYVRNRLASGGAGRKRLAWELRAHGVERQVAEESLSEIGEDAELALALEVAQRRHERLRDEEPEAQRRKLASFLQRRGFSYDTIDRVLRAVLPPE